MTEPRGRAGKRPRGGEATLSGGLLKVYGVGVFIIGDSGIGKSESSLELIARGHKFVSDDVVHVRRVGPGRLEGAAPSLSRNFMEIRGLGIINVRDLFGIAAVRDRKRIELVIHLEAWRPDQEYERLGLVERTHPLLGVEIPMLRIPVSIGRNVAILVEVAARNHVLKRTGVHAAQAFTATLGSSSAAPDSPVAPREAEGPA